MMTPSSINRLNLDLNSRSQQVEHESVLTVTCNCKKQTSVCNPLSLRVKTENLIGSPRFSYEKIGRRQSHFFFQEWFSKQNWLETFRHDNDGSQIKFRNGSYQSVHGQQAFAEEEHVMSTKNVCTRG